MHRAAGASLPETDEPTSPGQYQQAGESGDRDGGDLTEAGSAQVVRVAGPELRCRDDGVIGGEDAIRRLGPARGKITGGAGVAGET